MDFGAGVNARQVKNVPGRPKTDKLDAVRLAKLAEHDMVRPSFVPPKPVRQLRDFTRTRTVFVHERTRHKQRIEKVLRDTQIRLSSVATDPLGVSGRAMMEALIAGERSPRSLAGLAQGELTAKHDALIEAMTGQFEDHHARLLKLLLATVDHLSEQITALEQEIAASIDVLPNPRGAPKYFAAFRGISRSSSSSRTFLRRAASSASTAVCGCTGASVRRPRGCLLPASRIQLRSVSGFTPRLAAICLIVVAGREM